MSNQEPTRVNIQFSIEMDELPAEINRLVEKSSTHVATAEQHYAQLRSNSSNLTTEGWEGIDEIRKALAKSDQVLDDLQRIISGYLRMKSENFSPTPQNTVVDNEPDIEQEPESPFLAQHPDAKKTNPAAPFGNNEKMNVKEMQSQMMQVMAHMQQKIDSEDATEEEQKAADVLRNRISRVMGTDNENSSETGS